MTPHQIIAATIDPFVFDAENKTKNIIAALATYGFGFCQTAAWPHSVTEVCRDGEMRVMA